MSAKRKRTAVLLAGAMMLGCVNAWAAESPEASVAEQQETQQTAYELSFDGFQSAVRDGLAAREALGTALKDERLTEAEIQELYRAIAESEWEKVKEFDQDFLNDPWNENVEDRNYIRTEYLEGVKKQKDAGKNEGEDSFVRDWQDGYQMRACAITEMVIRFNCSDEQIVESGLVLDGETNESSDVGLVRVLQALEVAAGGLSDEQASLDGKAGFNTLTALKDLQDAEGLPTIRLINRKRVKELKEADLDLTLRANEILQKYGIGDVVENYLPQEVSQQETTAQ